MKWRGALFTTFLLLAITLFGSDLSMAQLNSSNFTTYQNSTYGFSISYPSDWKRINPVGRASVAEFLSPDGVIHGDIHVRIEDVSSKPKTLDQLVEEEINSTLYSNDSSDNKLIFSGPSTLAGQPAHVLIFSAKLLSIIYVKGATVFMIKNNKVYTVDYLTQPEDFDRDLILFNEMAGSFTLLQDARQIYNASNASLASETPVQIIPESVILQNSVEKKPLLNIQKMIFLALSLAVLVAALIIYAISKHFVKARKTKAMQNTIGKNMAPLTGSISPA